LVLLSLPLALTAGCRSNDQELFPITASSHWNYLVRTLNKTTDAVVYADRVAVGSTQGYELHGDLGCFHLAWIGGNLVTDQMAGARMLPPLPILTPASKRYLEWKGWIETGDKREPAKAKIFTDLARLPLNGNVVDTHRTLIAITLPDREINLTNWYQSGVGLVRQEQRTNGRLDLILDYLAQS
jgi:hypothetical protein